MNNEKRELPRTRTRHLGFIVDLEHKRLSITDKHRRKITALFNLFIIKARKRGGIPIRSIQKLLGLQIWISTVFRVARQFLTSTCDILRIAQNSSHFCPRKHQELTKRAVFDISFWRRFVNSDPELSFTYFLSRLPVNNSVLSIDASST